MKKKALSALVLGSLCAQASDMIRQPVEAFEQMGSKHRFGDPIDPEKLIDPRNHPSVNAVREESTPPPPEESEESSSATRRAPASEQRESKGEPARVAPDPFGGRHIPLTCGARCGIPLEDYNDSSKG